MASKPCLAGMYSNLTACLFLHCELKFYNFKLLEKSAYLFPQFIKIQKKVRPHDIYIYIIGSNPTSLSF